MNLGDWLKIPATSLRDYVLTALGILQLRPLTEPRQRHPAMQLKATDAPLWSYALISLIIGFVIQSAALARTGDIAKELLVIVPFSLWTWILAAFIAHITAKLFGGVGVFMDTLAACLRAIPTAYIIAAFTSLSVAVFARAIVSEDLLPAPQQPAFAIAQVIILAMYLPPDIRYVHRLGTFGQATIAVLIPLLIGGMTYLALAAPLASKKGVQSPAAQAQAAVREALAGQPVGGGDGGGGSSGERRRKGMLDDLVRPFVRPPVPSPPVVPQSDRQPLPEQGAGVQITDCGRSTYGLRTAYEIRDALRDAGIPDYGITVRRHYDRSGPPHRVRVRVYAHTSEDAEPVLRAIHQRGIYSRLFIEPRLAEWPDRPKASPDEQRPPDVVVLVSCRPWSGTQD